MCNIEQEEHFLISRLLENDSEAFNLLYQKYVKVLFSYGYELGAVQDLEDAIQDVFISLLTRNEQLKCVKNLKYFLIGCLRNRLIDLARQRSKIEFINEYKHEHAVSSNILEDLTKREKQMELRLYIKQLSLNLTARQKECIDLYYIKELKYNEIARHLNITIHSAQKLVSRAILMIRKGSAVSEKVG